MSTLADEVKDDKLPRISITQRIALFVLAPPLIAGGFAIAPKVYEEFTKPTSTLSYFVTSGPALLTDGIYRQIYSINIENAGKLPLTNVVAEVHLANGKIESFVTDKSGTHPNVSGSGPEYQLTAQRMLPGERVIASAMTDSPVADPSLQINIRSDEVLGILTDPSKRTKNASDDTIGAILAALSVFVMSAGLTFYVILRYRLKPIFQQSTVDKILKQEAVRYIAGLSEVFPVDSNILLTSSEITYVHLADLFLFNGINCNDDDKNKNKCVAGLRAILKVRYVAEESINIVRNNLELLGVKYLDADIVNLRENSFSLDDPKLRREIASLFLPS